VCDTTRLLHGVRVAVCRSATVHASGNVSTSVASCLSYLNTRIWSLPPRPTIKALRGLVSMRLVI
jgi:hypothetical protein